MAKVVDRLLSGTATLLHSLIVPIYFFIFIMYYRPFGTYELLNMVNASFTFNVTMMFCIVLVSVSITRIWMHLLGRFKSVSRPVYMICCVGETLVATLFVSLYIVLISPEPMPYFIVAGFTFLMMIGTNIYPYGFIWMGIELYALTREEIQPSDDNSLIRFHDEYRKLRLVIAPEAVIFIRSEDNYVQIHFIDQGKQKKFILRSSMKALEENLCRHGLVRCHRSYFINPLFIKIVHRDSSGLLVAQLKQDGYESIPISRKYQDAITRLL